MPSVITVTIKYSDNSRSLTESFQCEDTHPSAPILQNVEDDLLKRWVEMGQSYRDVQIHTKVK